MRIRRIAVIASTLLFSYAANAQTVFDPSDIVVDYNKNNPPVTPPANTVAKWVRTKHVPFNTDAFKCYYYNGLVFRLKFPKTYMHNVQDGKQYPLFVFFHGRGEKGTIYDDEFQLYHGGELHGAAVDDGTFDGFLLYPQSQMPSDTWTSTDYVTVQKIINLLIAQVKVDPYRIIVDGLSAGGSASWNFMINYPKLVGGCLPISAASTSYGSTINIDKYKYTPVWHFQGGLDQAPTPFTSEQLGSSILARGGNYRYTKYPTKGHGIWYNAWAEPDYFPFLNSANKTNPWTLFGRTEFCPGDNINVTIGVTAGFDGYEWRKEGTTINGATTNTLLVTEVGTYDCRIKNGTVWSYWSPVPVVIKIKQPTVTPDIQITGLASKVLPSPDGSAGVPLEEPEGYETYSWQKTPNSTVLGTTKNFVATTPGFYTATVTEKFGCSTSPSPLFEVIDANGTNPPDAPFNVSATETGKTSIQLHWEQTAAPANNETNFEIYQASFEEGPYKLVKITDTDISDYVVEGLKSGTTFYYIIRAINNTAASAVTTAVSATTEPDVTAPSAPSLRSGEITRTSVELVWDPSTDDVGVASYDVYVNGVKSFVTTDTTFTVYNLIYGKTYDFIVTARDLSDNVSDSSNKVTQTTLLKGLIYKYYQGNWNNLPNFKKLTPLETGVTPNVTIEDKAEEDNFAYYWEGNIKIPVSGVYTFRLTSNDGSKLYLAINYSYKAAATINNDGTHSDKSMDSTMTLNAGSYPFIVTYFQKITGATMGIYWNTPQTNGEFTPIPDSVFTDDVSLNSPSPLNIQAISQTKVTLTWADNNNNETGYQIWRATSQTGSYSLFKTVAANVATFTTNRVANNGSVYYFKVRAQQNDFYSAFSNVAGISSLTSDYIIKLNFNDGSVDGPPQSIPWNNTNSLPTNTFALNNLLGDSNRYTGVKIAMFKNRFDASNNGGAVTGNNTGAFPDNVMKSSWFLNRLDTSTLKISNLNQTMKYTFTFFSSRGGVPDARVTGFTINNQTVSVNATNNTSVPVQIDGVAPDASGNISFSVFAYGASDFGYINALVIKGTVNNSPGANKITSNVIAATTKFDNETNKNDLQAYPNPFDNYITVQLLLKQNVSKLNVALTDASGKTLYTDQFNDISKGVWQQRLNVNGRTLKHGTYFLRVYGLPGEKPKTIKLLK